MFTRNFYRARAASMADKAIEVLGSTNVGLPSLITVDGTVPNKKYSSSDNISTPYGSGYWDDAMKMPNFSYDVSAPIERSSNANPFSYAVFFGSGTTPPTIDDYRLEGEIAMNCTCSYVKTSSFAEDGTSCTHEATYTITNNNDEPVTIGEIGIFVCACWRVNYSSYISYPYLYERTVLESPITIPAGGVGQVTYSITENYLEP